MATQHLTPLHRAALEAVATAANVSIDLLKVDVPPRPEMGDLAVACHPITKLTKVNPVEVAKSIVAKFQPSGLLASATAAGPFVNFRADRGAVTRWVIDASLGGELIPKIGTGKTICIDYSSPNISKELAFHHIRSTGIGHSLAQIFRALDYTVVGINHLGDWGTTHGMLIAAFKKWHQPDDQLDIRELNELYVRWRDFTNPLKSDGMDKWIAANTDEARACIAKELARCAAAEDEARGWFKKLEAGDAEALALWQRFKDVSWAEFVDVYRLLEIEFEVVRGESAYEPDLAGVMAELRAKNMIVESEGAQVVWLEGHKVPVIMEKSDGASTYATRDFASAKYRHATWNFDRSLYVVAREQALHFKQVFGVLAAAGYSWAERCQHVPFGLVTLGGKKTSTRGGSGVTLRGVLGEAKSRALTAMAESPVAGKLPIAEALPLAEQVGVGAVLFANLVTQRDKDIAFEWEKALATTGDSGVYLQYAHARCAQILKKNDLLEGVGDLREVRAEHLSHDLEWAIAKRLLEFGDVVVRAAAACEPHLIAHYLLDLAGDFARYYTAGNSDESLRVLSQDAGMRGARIALTMATQATLAKGLALCGIPHPDQM